MGQASVVLDNFDLPGLARACLKTVIENGRTTTSFGVRRHLGLEALSDLDVNVTVPSANYNVYGLLSCILSCRTYSLSQCLMSRFDVTLT